MSDSVTHPPTTAHITAYWHQLCALIHQQAQERGKHLSRCVVLLPYAQLMPVARRFWAEVYPSGFVPQFQTSRNWASQVRGFTPEANDISFEAARDTLTATSLLEDAGLAGLDTTRRDLLAGRLVEAAHQLASSAAAIAPSQRLAWEAQARAVVANGLATPTLKWESALARMALAWVAASNYASDVLFEDALVKSSVDCLMVLEGLQRDPLVQALALHWGDQALMLPTPLLVNPSQPSALTGDGLGDRSGTLFLHQARDAQDEAQRASACVLRHIEAGRVPVALAATDRALTRRIRAMLATQNVAVRDENGWKLSTTRAAANIMASLDACAWNASSDSVLDWLKNASFVTPVQVQALEKELRRAGATAWQAWVQTAMPTGEVAAQSTGQSASQAAMQATALHIESLRERLQTPRLLAKWLVAWRELLQASGQWTRLSTDLAGEKVLSSLYLNEGAALEWTDLPQAQRRLSLAEFRAWVDVALEAASFVPPYPEQADNMQPAQVVILPMSQLLARPFAAAVLPGCDEVRLNPSPELPGLWSAQERLGLGLTTREEQELATRAAWHVALQTPVCDVLWRQTESSGEPLLPSALVQSLALSLGLEQPASTASEPRTVRHIKAEPTPRPLPVGKELPISRLSSSAYDKLRRCPYQFFALQQLGLQEDDELEDELGKRDFGLWLHAVLSHFHEQLNETPAGDLPARTAMLMLASEQVSQSMKLPADAFFPWAATWPRVRDGYLSWLAEHEATGAQYEQSETWQEMPLGALTLVGRIDRVDRQADGTVLVLDYKTENTGVTRERLKNPLEDTQLAFYAALMEADTLRAAYVNVGEKDGSKTFEQEDIVESRDALISGILIDMKRIGEGAVLPALGEGTACDYCAARGLCRKDFWGMRK